ncbi:hypothetical protein [Bradyrhizobium japonicum]|nr:hypothetical protein [Bradyrhizobium japonicum]
MAMNIKVSPPDYTKRAEAALEHQRGRAGLAVLRALAYAPPK